MLELNFFEIQEISGGAEGAASRFGNWLGGIVGTAAREIREHSDLSGCELIGMLIAGDHERYHLKS
jgi:hypothetical protein